MKEQVILSYGKGITNIPSDMVCTDGELADCVNLEVKEGELIPMEMPVKLGFTLSSEEVLVLVHNTRLADKNYVTMTDGILRIFRLVGNSKVYYDDIAVDCGELKSILYIGNTIVAYTSESPHYIIYSNEGYKYLGSKMPDISLSFGLKGDFVVSDKFDLTTPDTDRLEDEDFQRSVSQFTLAEVNKFVETESIGKGKFMFPFLVRYAIRLFDGTYTMHSSPVLMLPSTNIAPFVVSNAIMEGSNAIVNKTLEAQVGAIIAELEVSVSDVDGSFPDWSDVITSVDVFVSRQIYTYDQNGYKFYVGWTEQESEQSKFVGSYNDSETRVWDGYTLMKAKATVDISEGYLNRWYIPRREIEDIYSDVTDTSLFYKYSSLNASDLEDGYSTTLTGTLSALETGETMTDDYMTHDVFVPESSFVYNGRLNISNMTRKLFKGFPVDMMTNMVTASPSDGFDYDMVFGKCEVYTFIKSSSGGSDIIVKSTTSGTGSMYGVYLFYPDSDAYKMVIIDKTNTRYAEIQLTEHPLLNGAYYFAGFQPLGFVTGNMSVSDTSNEERLLNKLYLSNVNNPFHFPLEGIYTVGSDRIIGMGAVTRPISQGQFGEFPLIVFCSDGNYAMRVDEQGFYASISPMQEDVVLGSDKITSMEDSVAVITKKGIMLTTGGVMTKVAPQMDGGVFNASLLSGVKTVVNEIGVLVDDSSDNEGFLSYVFKSRMAFDYASNRLFVYCPDKTYTYVVNFDNGVVTKMSLGGKKIKTSVLDYPDTLIQDSSGNVYSLYEKEDVSVIEEKRYGFALTRPVKMGEVMTMKSVFQLMNLEANRSEGSYVRYNLYGSNDNKTYFKITSRFGKPYKFYRLAIYTCLLPKESATGTVMTIEKRRTHKIR